jgi:hypothetical protein
VQALSFGMTIPANGTLSTSNYSLIDVGSGTGPTPQTITFDPAPPATGPIGGGTGLSAIGGGSGNPVVFTVDPTSGAGVCSLSPNGQRVNYLALGTCVIDANQAGNANYSAAPQVQITIPVVKRNQTINFPAIGAKTLLQSPVTVTATASSGLVPVTFTTTTPTVCTAGGTNGATITLLALGTCTVQASQAGNGQYNPATATRNFNVTKQSQTITFAPLPNVTRAQGSVTVSATASSGLPVTFTTPQSGGICRAGGTNGATITLLGVGTCTVRALQAGNAQYNAAPNVNRTFMIS